MCFIFRSCFRTTTMVNNDCNGDINDEQHINNYGSFSKIDESINKKPGYDAMTKEERIELLQEDKLPPPLKPAISSSTSSSSSPQSPLKLKSATTTTTTTTRTKTKNKTTTHRSTGVAVTRTTADSNLDKIRVSFDNFKDENDNNDGGDNASIMSALTMRENFTMSTSSNTPMTTTTTASNSINKKKKKENPILKKFLSLWKVTTKNTSSRRKKNNNTLQNNNNNNNSNNDDEGDDEEDVYNGDSDADGGTTTISVSPINSNINSNINSSNKSSSSCLILLMEPISRTFEIMTIQYSPGISTVSNILEDIPLQSTFNFRLRFTNYIGLLGVGMTTVTTTTTTKKKKKNEEMKEVDMTTTITNCSHIHQLLQSKPVSKQYSCEYQFQQQKLLVEEKQEQEQQQQKEETKKHFMMVLVAILPDRCSGKNSTITSENTNNDGSIKNDNNNNNNSGNSNTSDSDSNSMIETTKRMACQLMTNPKIGLRLQYLQKQMVDNKNKELESSPSEGVIIDENKQDM